MMDELLGEGELGDFGGTLKKIKHKECKVKGVDDYDDWLEQIEKRSKASSQAKVKKAVQKYLNSVEDDTAW